MSTTAIVLAAGLGVRMKSKKPKVLHAAAGRPLIDHVIANLQAAGVGHIRLVVGHGAEAVKEHLHNHRGVEFYVQKNQLGTADAVKSAEVGSLSGITLICNGDHPLIGASDYRAALEVFRKSDCDLMVISARMKNPATFGRIVRNELGKFTRIVEEKDANTSQKKIDEVNSGLYVVKTEILKKLLPKIQNKNVKKEFYLTDLVSLCLDEEKKVMAYRLSSRVCRGVNNQAELAIASRALYLQKARALMEAGVTIVDPGHTYIEGQVEIAAGTTIYPGCFIQGETSIGENVLIESHCQIRDARIGDQVEVRWGSLIDKSEVKSDAIVGPYARIRPESVVGEGAHVGNFVELKKTSLGKGVKANHLAYLGDAEIGEGTNIGCGTITCNLAPDKKKNKTKIGKRVFVGSDTQFVAPITVGDDAVIGSGSTITKDVPAKALAVARGRQVIKENYKKES